MARMDEICCRAFCGRNDGSPPLPWSNTLERGTRAKGPTVQPPQEKPGTRKRPPNRYRSGSLFLFSSVAALRESLPANPVKHRRRFGEPLIFA